MYDFLKKNSSKNGFQNISDLVGSFLRGCNWLSWPVGEYGIHSCFSIFLNSMKTMTLRLLFTSFAVPPFVWAFLCLKKGGWMSLKVLMGPRVKKSCVGGENGIGEFIRW